MKFLSLLFLLASSAAFAGNGSSNVSSVFCFGAAGGVSSTITAAASCFPIPPGTYPFTISGGDHVAALVATDFYPLVKDGTHQAVPSGKSWHCGNIYSAQDSAIYWQLVSATAAITYPSTSLTGGVYETGVAGKYIHLQNGTSNVWMLQPGLYTFLQNAYPGFQVNAAANMALRMDCIETTP